MSGDLAAGAEHAGRPRVVLTFTAQRRESYLDPADLERLRTFAEPIWVPSEGGAASPELLDALATAWAVVVAPGAPRLDSALFDRAPGLRVIGELEGDRFAERIDVEEAWARGIVAVDVTNGSSYPVAEWALALMLNALRNAGMRFRRLIAGETVRRDLTDPGYVNGELSGKRVGLIGCGHMGRRLLELLRPFQVQVRVHDPYLAPEMADVLGVTLTALENVFRQSEVVVCLAPITPATRGMIGARELDWLQPYAVFVNVSRGPIVDSAALIERLKRGDGVRAGLDVFDPEPIPADGPLSEIRGLPNVFLSPHVASFTEATRRRFFSLMVDELERVSQGHQPRFPLTQRSLANRRGT